MPQSGHAAGFGDVATFGLTNAIRDLIDANGTVNRCTLAYLGGAVAGIATQIALGSAFVAADNSLVTVTHFTDPVTAQLIERSGAIHARSFVVLSSEIPEGATASEIETALEIRSGAGQTSHTFQVSQSSLLTPANGRLTSGGRVQFQLANPVSVAPGSFVPTPR